ncbi:hypothetical protein PR202_ga10818 [Eleusine coracana subsp. coracana]|uniref:Transmembrane protein n=1 Tax=Eleusine coracana subsp. coracana TaxID=191504 RepID=A0AAV5C7R1_ELECO|nr:hypothetical protein PR202_ga10818 [Eleusine coracana subsp. coracana]
MAFGVVVLLDGDTHTCDWSLQLSVVCAKVEHAAASYLFAGILNFVMALRLSWELARAYPIYRLFGDDDE